MSDFTGKYVVVTGGGKGIGAAVVARFVADNAAGVAILDYDETLAKKTAKKLDPSGKRVLAFTCDVGNKEQVDQAVKAVVEVFGTIDILINNAGITRDKMFHKMNDTDWDSVLRINLTGTYNLCSAVFPLMREKGAGRIVNISSTSAWGNVGQVNYAASKAGVIGLTRTLAKEGGPKNIAVNCIAPGFINTDMLATIPQDILTEFKKNIPLGRLGSPEELASAVAFLSSDEASFITGQCLFVSGGSHMI